MPLDQPGARAPEPLSRWALRLARVQRLRARHLANGRKKRHVTERRLREAEHLLGMIAAGADLIGDDAETRRAFILVTIESHILRWLCEFGADSEDLEDTHDAEPTEADQGEF